MVFVFIMITMLFVAGIGLKYILCGAGALAISLPVAWFFVLKPYQKERIINVFNPENDPSGTGYQVTQSKIAIGSGGLTGKGFLNGTQTSLKYVPEQDTDFIFCTVGEEQGFIGSTTVLLLMDSND